MDIPHSLLTSHGIVHGEGLQLADGGILEGTELRQQRHIGRAVRHHVGVRRLGQVHVNRVQGVHAGRPGVVAQRVTLIRDGILGHPFNKRLESFSPCYSQSLLPADFKNPYKETRVSS